MGLSKKPWKPCEKNNIKGTLVFLLQFLEYTKDVQEWAGDYDYILAFPTAGGHMQEDHLDGVLFDHLMLEGEQKHISNYSDLTTLLTSAGGSGKCLMIWSRWIWIHMAINAGVTSTAAHVQ